MKIREAITAEKKEAEEKIQSLERSNAALRAELDSLKKEAQRNSSDLLGREASECRSDVSADPLVRCSFGVPSAKEWLAQEAAAVSRSFVDCSRNFVKYKASSFTDKLDTTDMSDGITNPVVGQMDEVTNQIDHWVKRLKLLSQEALIFSNARHLKRVDEVISNGRLKSRATNLSSLIAEKTGPKVANVKSPKIKIVSSSAAKKPCITKAKRTNLGACTCCI
eukprot:TRINITY_DN8245_c0_g1_i1.p1 TRINITY_DN8245_c0_g1~~TRINITY_DN8245_c0_g1_i1.p1  ORF type:complete len:222 (-),score=43.76 TRINITY_DN8245_c0_g1_i1:237-902(-)